MDGIILKILDKMQKIDVSGLKVLKLFETYNSKTDEYLVTKKRKNKKNLDEEICKLFGNYYTLEEIMDKNLDISNLIDTFYGKDMESKFISTRICRDVINNLNEVINFKNDYRDVTIYYDESEDVKINKIDSILNFFDFLTKKKNSYKLVLFLSNETKKLNDKVNYIGPDNVNSGYSIRGNVICIWRKEELDKVLFHEIVHHLNLDMFSYQYIFNDYFLKLNLNSKFHNSNEAYTEVLGLMLLSIWKYYYYKFNKNMSIEDFVSKFLNIQLAWSYYQMAKVINFYGCFSKFEDIYDKSVNCEIKEKSNIVAYYFLKSYFLKEIYELLSFLDSDNVFISLKEVKKFRSNFNEDDEEIKKMVNYIINNVDVYEKSMKMTYLK